MLYCPGFGYVLTCVLGGHCINRIIRMGIFLLNVGYWMFSPDILMNQRMNSYLSSKNVINFFC